MARRIGVIFLVCIAACSAAAQVLTHPDRPVVQPPPDVRPPAARCPMPRQVHVKADAARYWRGLYRDRVVLKLQDDLALDLVWDPRQGPMFRTPIDRTRIDRTRIDGARIDGALVDGARIDGALVDGALVEPAQLAALNAILAEARPRAMGHLFSTRPEVLKRWRAQAEERSCRRQSDLAQYYRIYLAPGAQGETVAAQLNQSPLVEVAFLPPIPRNADIPPITGDFSARQGYLSRAARGGIDARHAWDLPGGRGRGMRVIDVEVTWNVDHEDLPRPFWFSGMPTVNEIANALNISEDDVAINTHHGTAVIGEMVARNDRRGVTGIAADAEWGAASVIRSAAARGVLGGTAGIHDAVVSAAIADAIEQSRAGDVILIEQHSPGPPTATTCRRNCGQFEYVPMEFFPDSFDAISTATALGIVVVEAAGNGSVNLDRGEYAGKFARATRDSEAILVGGSSGDPSTRVPNGSSNSGSRIDVHGWGDNVMTTGYGDIRANGGDVNQFYTATFSGTSSASPIVAGAVLSIQGVLKASGHGVLTPAQMRDLLTRTGVPQDGVLARPIGPLPNLRAALSEFDSATASAGGSSGEPFAMRCDDGLALVGVTGRAGWLIDQLRGICASPAGEEEPTRTTAGGGGGTPFTRRCEEGQVVVGFKGRSGAFLDSLVLECGDPADTSSRADVDALAAAGGEGGALFGPNRCPADRVAVGLRGRAGGFIDRLQLLCSAAPLRQTVDVPWTSRPVGGTGGAATRLRCNAGEVMVGVSADEGAFIDSIAPRCVAVNRNGSWNGQVRTRTRAGGDGGTRTVLDCPRDQAVSGISGRAGGVVDRLSLRCRALSGPAQLTGEDDLLGSVGGDGGEPFGRIDCPANLPAGGFAVRTGMWVDQLKLICGR